MPRYKLIVEYDGTPFAGWQIQTNGLSVQQVVEEAIGRFSSEVVRIHCAGRTNSGVHATHQVIHVDLAKEWPVDTVRNATNAYLKRVPVSVLQVQMVPAGFNARLSAIKRHYVYRILNRRAPPALDANRVWTTSSRRNSMRPSCVKRHGLSSGNTTSRLSSRRRMPG